MHAFKRKMWMDLCVFTFAFARSLSNGIPLFNNTIWCILHIILASCAAATTTTKLPYGPSTRLLFQIRIFSHPIFLSLCSSISWCSFPSSVQTCIQNGCNDVFAIHLAYTIFAQVNIIFPQHFHYYLLDFILFSFVLFWKIWFAWVVKCMLWPINLEITIKSWWFARGQAKNEE